MRLLASKRGPIAGLLEARLAQEAPEVTITWLDENGAPLGPSDDAEILFRSHMVGRGVLETALHAAPALRWLHTSSAGIDPFVAILRQYAPPGVIITRGSGTMALPIAEYVIGQIFASAKQFPTYIRAQDRHEWIARAAPPTRDVHGSRILILGLGSIGRAVARLALGVGMRVWATRRGTSAENDPAGLRSGVLARRRLAARAARDGVCRELPAPHGEDARDSGRAGVGGHGAWRVDRQHLAWRNR